MRTGLVSFALILVAASPALAEGLKPGLYELKTSIKAEGLPPGMGDQAMRQCLSDKDLQPDRMAEASNPDPSCKIKDQHSAGNVWTGTLVCKEGTVKVRSVSASDGWQTDMESQGGEMGQMTMRTVSKRIGDCKK
jgi:hypothetical protein